MVSAAALQENGRILVKKRQAGIKVSLFCREPSFKLFDPEIIGRNLWGPHFFNLKSGQTLNSLCPINCSCTSSFVLHNNTVPALLPLLTGSLDCWTTYPRDQELTVSQCSLTARGSRRCFCSIGTLQLSQALLQETGCHSHVGSQRVTLSMTSPLTLQDGIS